MVFVAMHVHIRRCLLIVVEPRNVEAPATLRTGLMTASSDISSDSLSEYVRYARSVVEKYPQMDEENTKWKLIREFLDILGWDVAFDAELEYSITMGNSSTYHVDYALSGSSSTPVLFVETKGYDTTLTQKHRSQLHSYLRQTDVNWGLLTNGQSYEIYRREITNNTVQIRTVAQLGLEELPQYADHVNLLSKDALESGRSQELAQRILDLRSAKRTLQDEKEEIASNLARVLTDAAGEVISQESETEAKVLVDRLVDTVENRTESQREDESSEPVPAVESESGSFWEEVEQVTGISRTENSVELVEGTTAKSDLVNFVSFSFDSNYLTQDDVPYGNGWKRYILNSENANKMGDEMSNPEKIADEVYLETHAPKKQIKQQIVELGELAKTRYD